MAELIVLVDEDGTPIGTAEKLSSHHATTPLHLAFSCYVFNDDHKCLVTRRSRSKRVWPGVWTNSVCGHPGPGEPTVTAIQRRLKQELNMEARDIQVILPRYRYKTPAYAGIIENEVCPVYIARAATDPTPNPEEVEAVRWSTWSDLVREVEADQESDWSWWCKDQLILLREHPELLSYVQVATLNGGATPPGARSWEPR
jgi:isopentenyl-diphosphate Delta-isomerase